jgi:hypothetical protein
MVLSRLAGSGGNPFMKKVLTIVVAMLLIFLLARWIWHQFLQSDEDKIRVIIAEASENVADRNLLPLFKDFSPDFRDDHGLDLSTLQGLTYRVFGRTDAFRPETDIQDIQIGPDGQRARVAMTIQLYPVRQGETGPEIFQAVRRSNLFYILFVKEGGDWQVWRSGREPFGASDDTPNL